MLVAPLETLTQPRTLVAVGLLAVFWSWEGLRPFREYAGPRGRHAVRNLGLALLNTLLLTALLGGATALVAAWTQSHRVGLLDAAVVGEPWRMLTALLLLDAWTYLWHRANHAVPFLWRFHRVHHSDAAMDVTTATRFHTGELLLSGVLRLGLIPLLGLSLEEVLLYDVLTIGITQFHHANISLGRWERWLRWLIVTPAMHQVHHSLWQPETDSNYAVVLSVWDRLASTFRRREDVGAIELGLDGFDDERMQTLVGMLASPFSRSRRSESSRHAPSGNRLAVR